MSYVITGAAGHLGRRAAELLLDRVAPADVVLVTRRPDDLADLAARGADVRFGDFDAPDSLPAAFAGGERLLLISTDAVGARIAQHGNAIDAAKAAGVHHISYTSVGDPSEDNPAGVVPDHRATEGLLADSGLAWTSLRNALYSEYRIPEAEAAAASGVFGHNQGDGRTAYVARTDCAAAAVAVLTGGPEHDGVAYDITGPELLGADDLARLYAEATGSPVVAEHIDDEPFIAGLVGVGLPPFVAELVASFGTAIRGGHLAQQSSAVEDLTGLPPLTVASVLAARPS
jgi:NAD(P)H dehydrogenase (quinone)